MASLVSKPLQPGREQARLYEQHTVLRSAAYRWTRPATHAGREELAAYYTGKRSQARDSPAVLFPVLVSFSQDRQASVYAWAPPCPYHPVEKVSVLFHFAFRALLSPTMVHQPAKRMRTPKRFLGAVGKDSFPYVYVSHSFVNLHRPEQRYKGHFGSVCFSDTFGGSFRVCSCICLQFSTRAQPTKYVITINAIFSNHLLWLSVTFLLFVGW